MRIHEHGGDVQSEDGENMIHCRASETMCWYQNLIYAIDSVQPLGWCYSTFQLQRISRIEPINRWVWPITRLEMLLTVRVPLPSNPSRYGQSLAGNGRLSGPLAVFRKPNQWEEVQQDKKSVEVWIPASCAKIPMSASERTGDPSTAGLI